MVGRIQANSIKMPNLPCPSPDFSKHRRSFNFCRPNSVHRPKSNQFVLHNHVQNLLLFIL